LIRGKIPSGETAAMRGLGSAATARMKVDIATPEFARTAARACRDAAAVGAPAGPA